MIEILANSMEIPTEWVLGAIVSLGFSVAAVSKILWDFAKSKFSEQREEIKILREAQQSQNVVIAKLQSDIERLSRGCGIVSCIWRNRTDEPQKPKVIPES